MRNFLWLLSLIFVSLALITGCNSSPSAEVDGAITAAEKYKNIEYDVKASEDILSAESAQKRMEEMKPLCTDAFYKKATETRYTLLPLQVAHTQGLSLKPQNLHFKLNEHKKVIIVLNYTLDLLLLDEEGNEDKRIPLEGILTLFDVNGQWLVQGDRFDNPAFMKLIEQ